MKTDLKRLWHSTESKRVLFGISGMLGSVMVVWIMFLVGLAPRQFCISRGTATLCSQPGASIYAYYQLLALPLGLFSLSFLLMGRSPPPISRKSKYSSKFLRMFYLFLFTLPLTILANYFLIYSTTWEFDSGLHYVLGQQNATTKAINYVVIQDTYKIPVLLSQDVLLFLSLASIVSSVVCFESFRRAWRSRPSNRQKESRLVWLFE